ncbi:glycosyltransferase [Gammaproteobacteria bacterium]|jgi:glycosyltransferase involved in cell wall biosynthesis|nr:glycosyltransferase [Gammaproteobacteria bacterium]
MTIPIKKYDVLLPAFNAENTIKRTLESIIAQSVLPSRVVIIIDGCSDGTEDIVDEYINDSILEITKIVCKTNIGLVGALNKGLKICRSEWIARIDADDYWLSDHLYNLTNTILEDKTSRLALVGGTSKIMQNDKIIKTTLPLKDEELRSVLQRDNPFVHSAVAFKRDAVEAVGGYRKSYIYEDYDLWIRLLSQYKGEIIESGMCVHVRSDDTLTANISLSNALEERLRLQYMAFQEFGFVSIVGLLSMFVNSLRVTYRRYLLVLFQRKKA